MIQVHDATVNGNVVVLYSGMPLWMLGSPSRVALGLTLEGETCMTLLLPVCKKTQGFVGFNPLGSEEANISKTETE